jgi:crotonobetainyl-CoA:carnitine CoA-transferase CaiB-like acyl-CoA transferase
MLATASHAGIERVIDYAGRPDAPTVDAGGHGYHALYRLYPAAEGWVFLAAPTDREFAELRTSLGEAGAALDDERFAGSAARAEHDTALAGILGALFAGAPAAEWETNLTAGGVGCVQVFEGIPEVQLQTDPALAAEYTVTTVSPIFDEHLRLGPAVRFSRSATQANGGVLTGEDTDPILIGLGYDKAAIADLRARSIVA